MKFTEETTMKKRLTAIMILLGMLVTASCAEKADDTPDEGVGTKNTVVDVDTEPEETQISDDLPEGLFYDGKSFRMLIRNDVGWIEDMYVEESNGEIMNDAVYDRNQKVSERFGVKFELIKSSNANLDYDGYTAIQANEDAYEIIVPHARASFGYASNGYVLDWYSDMPYINFEKPYWNKACAESFSIGGRLYMMVGDLSYKNLGATDAMLFNTKLFTDLGIEYPYELVSSGAWTLDKLAEYAAIGTNDINGDGKFTMEDDCIGYITDEWIGPIQVLYSGNQRIVMKDENDLPYLSLNTPTTVELFEKYFKLIDSDAGLCRPWEGLDTSVASGRYARFVDNQALFVDGNIREIAFLRNMDADFGVVPWPKLDETVDKYYSNVDAGCNLFVIPITISDAEMVSAVLEALSCEGYKTVIPAFFDVALSTKYSRDSESIEMLNLVKAGRVYDLGYYNANLNLNSVGQTLFTTNKRDFASYYAKSEKAAQRQLDKDIKQYTGEE